MTDAAKKKQPKSNNNNKPCEIEGEERVECGRPRLCDLTCNNYKRKSTECAKMCVPRCQCPEGTVLFQKENKCVDSSECPRSMRMQEIKLKVNTVLRNVLKCL